MGQKVSAAATIKDIRRQTRRQHNAEEKIRIVLEGLRDEETIAELCRREGIAQSLYYKWSKEFLEAGKSRLAGNTKRQASVISVRNRCAGSMTGQLDCTRARCRAISADPRPGALTRFRGEKRG